MAKLLRNNCRPGAIQHVANGMSARDVKSVSDHLGNASGVRRVPRYPERGGGFDQVRRAENRADAGKRDRLERMLWMWLNNLIKCVEKGSLK